MAETPNLSFGPVGPEWHTSYEKDQMNAAFVQAFGGVGFSVVRQALLMVAPYGYVAFNDERVLTIGDWFDGGEPVMFPMPKIQSKSKINLPLAVGERETPLPEAAKLRYTGADEIIQFGCVSTDPAAPGLMSVMGRRPQSVEELLRMRDLLPPEKYGTLFADYCTVYDAIPPAVLSVESLLDDAYEPGTAAFCEQRARLLIKYHNEAGAALDMLILTGIIAAGLRRYVEVNFFNSVNAQALANFTRT